MRVKLVGLLSISLASFGIWQGVASASGGTRTASAPVQQGNGDCGADDSGNPVIGNIMFARKGRTVTLDVTLTGADANSTYSVFLWENAPSFCTFLASAGTVTTDGSGDGSATLTVSVPGKSTQFFADPEDGSGANDTPTVTLR